MLRQFIKERNISEQELAEFYRDHPEFFSKSISKSAELLAEIATLGDSGSAFKEFNDGLGELFSKDAENRLMHDKVNGAASVFSRNPILTQGRTSEQIIQIGIDNKIKELIRSYSNAIKNMIAKCDTSLLQTVFESNKNLFNYMSNGKNFKILKEVVTNWEKKYLNPNNKLYLQHIKEMAEEQTNQYNERINKITDPELQRLLSKTYQDLLYQFKFEDIDLNLEPGVYKNHINTLYHEKREAEQTIENLLFIFQGGDVDILKKAISMRINQSMDMIKSVLSNDDKISLVLNENKNHKTKILDGFCKDVCKKMVNNIWQFIIDNVESLMDDSDQMPNVIAEKLIKQYFVHPIAVMEPFKIFIKMTCVQMTETEITEIVNEHLPAQSGLVKEQLKLSSSNKENTDENDPMASSARNENGDSPLVGNGKNSSASKLLSFLSSNRVIDPNKELHILLENLIRDKHINPIQVNNIAKIFDNTHPGFNRKPIYQLFETLVQAKHDKHWDVARSFINSMLTACKYGEPDIKIIKTNYKYMRDKLNGNRTGSIDMKACDEIINTLGAPPRIYLHR